MLRQRRLCFTQSIIAKEQSGVVPLVLVFTWLVFLDLFWMEYLVAVFSDNGPDLLPYRCI